MEQEKENEHKQFNHSTERKKDKEEHGMHLKHKENKKNTEMHNFFQTTNRQKEKKERK